MSLVDRAKPVMALYLLLSLTGNVVAAEKVKTLTPEIITIETTIVGSKEKPKFLTIVPWRVQDDSRLGLAKKQYQSKEKFNSIGPAELQRQQRLYQQLQRSK
ncbi:hypothetical protein [Psychrobium sp. 1_MG-2023]|uniref:hypothetical protein n=1 Tax=Psychrobium sp. 1_MG-2023 TaxID=3062624 RepID=UPI000C34A1CA|nr:hypothetical protein [Psychrobium sp. 1_MG-2023]MDP2559523.1 hypothetical protein [Psychrobium sp. 1_MG-2023]PKF59363.1 hypothetical protein CW748_00895 [Alteromonadales bacterium alter-6D02]